MLSAFAVLLCVTALLAYLNERFLHFPTTVGVTLAGALASILLIVLDALGLPGLRGWAAGVLETLDFTEFVLNGILSVLLFAGALSLNARQMLRQRRSILLLAFLSTLISTALIGFAAYGVFALVGLDVPLMWALLFGALISPTDPVAVLDLLKRARVPLKIETLIAGESLFNDGVGVVIFLALAGAAGLGGHGGEVSAAGVAGLFAREALGGLAFGALLGGLGYALLKGATEHAVEILLTLALVVGGYAAAAALGISGPLAMVVAGLIISAWKHELFTPDTQELVEGFWETIDQVLNIVLFAFIGLDVLLTETTGAQILASVLLIGAALAARWISVAVPFALVRAREGYGAYTVRLLTWGGLRGGIAISLALGLPDSPYRTHLVTVTYAVVLFTIAVQGLTIMPIVRRAVEATPEES
ncbi:sodium:proton antiporter [Deinococcus arenae]|uniref:Sodium:proton antiporter n=1 Tax=Deinococcus arenae TaxID=1452751 RepID=A0A8H9LC76_9DEIO|nr:sodium:proton antiporter [Deinococcus arenae]AWT34709.1 sodium:proton antiporter [Deinococcus actinosclerus]GGM50653.1 sodium:proton antiporter [Deinococcus arenae]